MSSVYPRGLQPSSQRQEKRSSRISDMDFEDALHSSGTFKIKESIDLNDLGVEASPAGSIPPTPPHKPAKRIGRSGPNTPIVVPPTPSPAGTSSARVISPPSPTRSSMDVFFDAEDHDIQTKRRSMYRSPGTSSSPDLATLVRKAKERGKPIPSFKPEKRQELPPLPSNELLNLRIPDANSNASRTSTSAGTDGTTSTQATPHKSHSRTEGWQSQSPRNGAEKQEAKSSKASVRAKTSAFLGKMWGQSATRERSKTDATLPTTSLADAFQPPLPPIPREFTETNSPIGDAFMNRVGTADEFRQLAPSRPSTNVDSTYRQSEDSIVFVERSPAPSTTNPTTPSRPPRSHNRRRSMSLDEIDASRLPGGHAAIPPLPATLDEADSRKWGLALNGLLTDFKGQLSSLEPTTAETYTLNDPSTPARRRDMARAATDGAIPSSMSTTHQARAPTLTVQPAVLDAIDTSPRLPSPSDPSKQPNVRSASVPTRTLSAGSSHGPSAAARYNPNILHSRPANSASGSSRDASRIQGQYRSAASNSEPSLLPAGGSTLRNVSREQRRSVRLVTATNPASPTDTVASPVLTQEPASDDTGRASLSSNARQSDEAIDTESRGKELASKCYAEDEDFMPKEKIAEWLGGHGAINGVALRYYIDFFDFSGMRLDHAFRRLCAKLYLKAETQQVDRILEQFSRRYWECNPKSVYGSASLVHAVSYSLLLLNTDLHVAELATRMSRSQFVRNTLAAIQTQINPVPSVAGSMTDVTSDDNNEYPTIRAKRSDSNASWNSTSRETFTSSGVSTAASSATQVASLPDKQNGSSTSVPSTHELKPVLSRTMTYDRNWENEMEATLKEMYSAIKSQQILQPQGQTLGGRSPSSTLSPGSGNMLRNRSVRSQQDRMATLKRGSVRGFGTLMNQQGNSPYGNTLHADGRTSPSPSFATSMGDGYHGSSSSFLTPTLGFASNLSHTIIRETQEDDHRSIHSDDSASTTISITDEELALLGAPWAKEGTLCRKQYWESTGKRAKNKNWMDVFVVIQKGELSMFIFGDHSGGGGSGGMGVGGGNWLENASSVGSVQLAHSLAHALPPPGYNRQRPYCMVLTLANGGVYFFQAGTEDLVNEWVSTCNYWAARTSKEPLAGGVSNMEYGWSRLVDSKHDRTGSEDEAGPRDLSDSISVRSGKSTRSKFGWRDGSPSVDRIFINDWKAPQPPSVSSVHDEESQMEALQKHVASMKKDLSRHQGYRQPMTTLYQPRSSNALKAQGNWERKSQYLLTEIVKYDSYIDSLQRAMALRMKRRGDKALERALVAVTSDDATDDMGAIAEADEEAISPRVSLMKRVDHSDTEDDE